METKPENDKRERLRVLADKIATEQNHDKFTALVEEMSELLDGQPPKPHDSACATNT